MESGGWDPPWLGSDGARRMCLPLLGLALPIGGTRAFEKSGESVIPPPPPAPLSGLPPLTGL